MLINENNSIIHDLFKAIIYKQNLPIFYSLK